MMEQDKLMGTVLPDTKISYSQNFLESSSLVENLLDRTSINNNDVVYEIGAGKGIITSGLLRRSKRVVAFELDERFYQELKEKFQSSESFELHREDFLTTNLPLSTYKVFSNIPFNITADIIRKLTEADVPPEDAYLVVQQEAAYRFLGLPYSKETLLSLLIKPFFELNIIHKFKRADFKPTPKVDSLMLGIHTLPNPVIEPQSRDIYRDFITYAFNQWRPTLKEALRNLFTPNQFARLSKDLDFLQSATPTQLNFNQWLGLFNYFLSGVDSHKRTVVMDSSKRLANQQKKLQRVHRTRIDRNWRYKEKEKL